MYDKDLKKHIIVAADVSTQGELEALLAKVGSLVGTIKVGLELQTALGGPQAVRSIQSICPNADIMYDLKLKDIPATMGRTAAQIAKLGVWAFTVHASAGIEGMRAAAKSKGNALMLGVTVLTTMTEDYCLRIYGDSIENTVLRFASDALEGGADGLVCSPRELLMLERHERFRKLVKVVPNARPKWAVIEGDDQNAERSLTPKQAIMAGGWKTRLVMGRPVTHTFPNVEGGPAANVDRILTEINEGFNALTEVV